MRLWVILSFWLNFLERTLRSHFYRLHSKDGEGNSFTSFVSSHPGGGGGYYPGQVHMGGGGYLTPPHPDLAGGRGYPKVPTPLPSRPGQDGGRGTPRYRVQVPTPPPPSAKDLLLGGRYASCSCAGGLSCFLKILNHEWIRTLLLHIVTFDLHLHFYVYCNAMSAHILRAIALILAWNVLLIVQFAHLQSQAGHG